MKNNFKRTISLVLAVLMVMTVVPFSGMAIEEPCPHTNAAINVIGALNGQPRHYIACTDCGVDGPELCDGPAAETCGEAPECTLCEQIIGEPLDHSFTEEVEDDKYLADAGDCQTKKTYYKSCSVCEASSEGTENAPIFEGDDFGAHVWGEYVSDGDATCTADGHKTAECTVDGCDGTDKVVDEGSKLDHSFTKEIVAEKYFATAATCTELATYYKSCECGEKGTETFTTGELEEHDYEVVPVSAARKKSDATCTSPAVYYKNCSECYVSAAVYGDEDATFEDGDTIDHVFKEIVHDDFILIRPTCEQMAMYTKSCEVCKTPKVPAGTDPTDENVVIDENDIFDRPALGHDMEITEPAKAATCTENGHNGIYKCKNSFAGVKCDHEEKEIIEATGHVDKITQEYKAPTCVQYGQYGIKGCENCSDTWIVNEKGETLSIGNLTSFSISPYGVHLDEDDDMVCDRVLKGVDKDPVDGKDDVCGALLEPVDLCTCVVCNGTGLMYFVGLILNFIWRLLGRNQYCDCGVMHYE